MLDAVIAEKRREKIKCFDSKSLVVKKQHPPSVLPWRRARATLMIPPAFCIRLSSALHSLYKSPSWLSPLFISSSFVHLIHHLFPFSIAALRKESSSPDCHSAAASVRTGPVLSTNRQQLPAQSSIRPRLAHTLTADLPMLSFVKHPLTTT